MSELSAPIRLRMRLGLGGSLLAAALTGGGAWLAGLGVAAAIAMAILAALADTALWAALRARHEAAQVRAASEALRRHADAVEARDRLFFGRMSQEFRTPLTLILAGFRALSEDRDTPVAVRREVATAGLRNTARVLLVLHELGALARLDPSERAPRKRVIDLAALVRRVAGNFSASGAGRRLDLVGMDAPIAIDVDPHQIQTVLYALLSNAFHRTDPITGTIQLGLEATSDQVILTLRDNGPAPEPEAALDATVTERGGPGLSLAVVRELIGGHSGAVETAAENPGQRVAITLPRGARSTAPVAFLDESTEVLDFLRRLATPAAPSVDAPATPAEPDISVVNPSLPLVMVLAANADLRGWLRRVLSARYAVATGGDDEASLAHARALRPQLLVVDADVPADGRPSLIAVLRRDPTLCATPLIGLTARVRAEADPEALSADDYLELPFDADELAARVASQIRARVQADEIASLHHRLDATITDQLRALVRSGDLRKYLPQALVEGALKRRPLDAPRIERRFVTVLCTELHGFGGLVERMEPDDLARLLDAYQREVSAEASAFGGVVEQRYGDGLTILFGALDPQHPADQALAAAKTALAVRDQVRALAERWHRFGLPHALDAATGMHTGTGLLGVFGSELTARYTVVGPTAQIATRLSTGAQAGQILASLPTFATIRNQVTARPHAPLPMEGGARALEIWSLQSLRPPSTSP